MDLLRVVAREVLMCSTPTHSFFLINDGLKSREADIRRVRIVQVLESPGISSHIFQAWEVLESDLSPGM